MNKELEALKELYAYAKIDDFNDVRETSIIFSLIKSALERKEKLEEFVKVLKKDTIINDLNYIVLFDTYKQYVEDYNAENWNIVLNKTEFNLLKEMLEEK